MLPLLARQMIERGWRVTVIAFSPEQGADTVLADLDAQWGVVRISRSGGPLLRWPRFARALRRYGEHANAVLAFSLVSVGIPLRLARLKGVSSAVRMGGDFFWERYTDWGGTQDLAAWTASRHWTRIVSASLSEWLFRGFDRVSYTTEYQQSIHAAHYRSLARHDVLESAPPRAGTPEKHKRGAGPFRVLWIGRMVAFKNLSALIEAVSRDPDLHLTVAGHGPEASALRRLAHRSGALDRVAFLPAVNEDQKRALYHAHDLFVVPSHSDISPRAALEARAAGMPVLLTDRTGLAGALVDGMVLRRLARAADILQTIHDIREDYELIAARAAVPPRGGTLEDEAEGLCDLVASLRGMPARTLEEAGIAV